MEGRKGSGDMEGGETVICVGVQIKKTGCFVITNEIFPNFSLMYKPKCSLTIIQCVDGQSTKGGRNPNYFCLIAAHDKTAERRQDEKHQDVLSAGAKQCK